MVGWVGGEEGEEKRLGFMKKEVVEEKVVGLVGRIVKEGNMGGRGMGVLRREMGWGVVMVVGERGWSGRVERGGRREGERGFGGWRGKWWKRKWKK